MRALSRVLLVVVVGLCSLVPGAAPAQNYVLQGYAWDTSVSPGQSLPFSVSDMSGANPGGIIVPYSVYRAGSQDSTPLATGTSSQQASPYLTLTVQPRMARVGR